MDQNPSQDFQKYPTEDLWELVFEISKRWTCERKWSLNNSFSRTSGLWQIICCYFSAHGNAFRFGYQKWNQSRLSLNFRMQSGYQVGEGVINDELVWISVAVTTFVCSSRIVVITLLPLKMIGTSVEAVSVTVVTYVVVDSSVVLKNSQKLEI